MARLTLTTRAERLASALVGRDITNLPKYLQKQVNAFVKAIGIDAERFIGYAPSTRQRYIRAARQGRTAAQERERVRVQRQERKRRKLPPREGPGVDLRRAEIERLRAWLDERIDTHRGPITETDYLEEDILLTPDSIENHIRVYGEDYVLTQLRGMQNSYNDPNVGNIRWHGFKASEVMPDHPDERWYWYHGKPRIVTAHSLEELNRLFR